MCCLCEQVDERYDADLERNRHRLWEEDAEREIGRLTRLINILQDNLSDEVRKNAKLREDLDELHEVKSTLTEERRLRAETEEICAKQEMDLDKHRKEIDQQKTYIALLRAHVVCSEYKKSEFQHQIDDPNWVKELELRDKELAAIKCSIAQLKDQIAAMESPTSRLQHQRQPVAPTPEVPSSRCNPAGRRREATPLTAASRRPNRVTPK
ncbi:uncharacterized protein LOC111868404 [Cryptotermes secundus]|uniref:uncharacterized protein LOC111868404 n=1 Tax=Cryptotermes secundus TaxID=105785 RepID=UPI000CD7CD61|nr:uncharacterized protein LOC111868404 [Cryptotermes secundus]